MRLGIPEDADAAEREARLREAQNPQREIEGSWTQHGLNLSGRINAIHQGDNPLLPTMYAGAAAGGLWRSVNNGNSWDPITEAFEHMAIGDGLPSADATKSCTWARAIPKSVATRASALARSNPSTGATRGPPLVLKRPAL